MIHLKANCDDKHTVCGLAHPLPDGHVWFWEGEIASRKADCPKCHPEGPQPIGTPISQLSGRPDRTGFKRFCEIAESWGYP